MFIGHYGPAFAAKAMAKSVPLWVLFVAAQWIDFLWAALIISGVEHARIVINFFGLSPLDLYYMPFSHGLPSAALLSLLIGGLVALLAKGNQTMVIGAVAFAAFMHWLFDLIVHRPDLPLVFDEMKVGLGLWAHPYVSVPTEIALMFAGLWLYDRNVPSATTRGTWALWIFGIAMALLQVQNTFFNEHPSSPEGFASLALFGFVTLAALAALVDHLRKAPKQK